MKINIFLICVVMVGAAMQSSFQDPSLSDNHTNPYAEALEKKPWESVQAYVEVRPGAFMFYWLYYADGTRAGAAHKPLVIWIQGGLGYAASGVAHFMEIGPLDALNEMQPRNHTWVKGRNLLLIDHPVGTGFSYATDDSLYARTDTMMVDDLLKTIEAFFETHKMFNNKTPTYIFGKEYGGKICPILAYKAIKSKSINMNLKGLGLGNGYVNPVENIRTFPKFQYITGKFDQSMYLKSDAVAKKICYYVGKKNYLAAFNLRDMLNIFSYYNEWLLPNQKLGFIEHDLLMVLDNIVNKYVKPTLKMVKQSLYWSHINTTNFFAYNPEHFISATKFLEMLLNETLINIAVYNGNLEENNPLAGASNWVHKLRWPGADEFRAAKRVPINGHGNGMYKQARQLSFWSVFGSVHWIPEYNPTAMEHILEYLISSSSK